MSAIIGSLRAELSANIAQFQSDMGKAADSLKGFSKEAKKVARECEDIGRQMSIAFTLPLAALGIEATKAAQDAAQALLGLRAAIASTGNASGKTAEQLEESANQLRAISTFSRADILKGVTTNLLTFGNVQGAVFERAQLAIVNLSARLGTDLQGATIKVGRALQDPIKGVMALTRLGVQFTEQQKEQIKQMVTSGHGQEAQGIILDALAKRYDGAAQAMRDATPTAALKNTWEDFTENVGGKLVPALKAMADILSTVLDAFDKLGPGLQKTIIAAAAVLAVIGPLVAGFGFFLRLIALLAPLFAPVVAAFASFTLEGVVAVGIIVAIAGALIELGRIIYDVITVGWSKAWANAKNDIKGVADSIPKAFAAIKNFAVAPTVTKKTGAAGPTGAAVPALDFNMGTSKIAGQKAFETSLVDMQKKIANTLGGIIADKATAQAQALNDEIDAFIKKAQEAGVGTAAFGTRIDSLRLQIENLKQAGLAKEAKAFAQQVDAEAVSVDKFAKGGLPALQEKLQAVDDQYKQLHDKISDEIEANAVLASSNDDAAKAMERLRVVLAGLEAAHDKARIAAENQYAAEQGIAHLQSFGAQNQTLNAIQDARQGGGLGAPISTLQADLQTATRDLQTQLIEAETKYEELVKRRQDIENSGSDQQKADLETEIALQKQLADLIGGTTAQQLVAAKTVNDAYKALGDSVSTDLTNMVANWNGDLSSLGATFKTFVNQLLLKPIMDDLATGIGGILKSALGGSNAGGGVAGSGIGALLSSFSGFFAGGGTLNPGEWGIAGENGPERVFGGTNGLSVMPNQPASRRSGDTYIDARGADDAAVQRLAGVVADLQRREGGRVQSYQADTSARTRYAGGT
jgi:hypothetical protein